MNPTNTSGTAFLWGKLGRWFARNSALNWELLSIKTFNNHVLCRDQGTVVSALGTATVSVLVQQL